MNDGGRTGRSTDRRRWLIAVVVTAIALLTLTTAAAALVAAPAGTSHAPHRSAEPVAGIDVDEIVQRLVEGGHAAVIGEPEPPGQPTDPAALAAAVSTARADGLDLWVLSVATTLTERQAAEVAKAIQVQTGGTVLVLAPEAIGVVSATLSDSDTQEARSAAAAAGDDVAATRAFADSVTSSSFPVSLVVIAGVIVLVAAGGVWTRTTRRRTNAIRSQPD